MWLYHTVRLTPPRAFRGSGAGHALRRFRVFRLKIVHSQIVVRRINKGNILTRLSVRRIQGNWGKARHKHINYLQHMLGKECA